MRSNIRMLASTAIPIVRMIPRSPAIQGGAYLPKEAEQENEVGQEAEHGIQTDMR